MSSFRSSCSAACQNSSSLPLGMPASSQSLYARAAICFSLGLANSTLLLLCRLLHGQSAPDLKPLHLDPKKGNAEAQAPCCLDRELNMTNGLRPFVPEAVQESLNQATYVAGHRQPLRRPGGRRAQARRASRKHPAGQDARVHVEKINAPFRYTLKGWAPEFGAGLACAVEQRLARIARERHLFEAAVAGPRPARIIRLVDRSN